MDRQAALQLLYGLRDDLRRARSLERGHLDDEGDALVFGEMAHVDQHQADAGSETYEREKELTIVRMLDQELVDVDHALARLATGTYGRCEACGAAIDDDRLQAVPATRFCEADQRARDLDRVSDAPALGAVALTFLTEDDDVLVVTEPGAEEGSLHLDHGGGRLPGDRLERAEAVAWAEREQDEEEATEADRDAEGDVSAALADEEGL